MTIDTGVQVGPVFAVPRDVVVGDVSPLIAAGDGVSFAVVDGHVQITATGGAVNPSGYKNVVIKVPLAATQADVIAAVAAGPDAFRYLAWGATDDTANGLYLGDGTRQIDITIADEPFFVSHIYVNAAGGFGSPTVDTTRRIWYIGVDAGLQAVHTWAVPNPLIAGTGVTIDVVDGDDDGASATISLTASVVQVTADATIDGLADLYEVDCSAGTKALTLPTVASVSGRTFRICPFGGGEVQVTPDSSEPMEWQRYDGAAQEFTSSINSDVDCMLTFTAGATRWYVTGRLD